MSKKFTILSLSWRDIKSPKAGGAERHTFEMLRNADKNKFHFVQFGPMYEGLAAAEEIEGITFMRKGNVATCIFYAWRYYRKHKSEIDFVIDQCNTHRFFTRFWVPKEKRIFYIHQLTREIWEINSPGLLGKIGRVMETPMLRLQRHDFAITVSESTRQELVDVGFDEKKIAIIPNALSPDLLGRTIAEKEESNHNFIYVGRYSKYKGMDAAIEALGSVREKYPDAKLRIVGKRDEQIVKDIIEPLSQKYGFSYGVGDENDVILCGFVSEEEKISLMGRARVLLFPSLREGWGIIVSEAAAVGTPSIVYDSPGCRDAVDYGRAGYLCRENSADELARIMIDTIEDDAGYREKQIAAYNFVQGMDWEKNGRLFDELGIFR